jgi:hypothetical protein
MTSPVCLLLPAEPELPTPPPGVYRGDNPEMFLWPGNGPHDIAPGALRPTAGQFGPGLDRGALRRQPDGSWEYLEFGAVWTPWEPSKRLHLVAASAFRRYGVGWSFGPAWNGHTEHIGYVLELCGIDLPNDSMAALDLEHNNLLFRQLQREWMEVFGEGGTGTGTGTGTKGTSPVCRLLPPEPVLPPPPPGVYRGDRPETFLWPANGPRDKAPGAIRSVTAQFGPGLDRGALRRQADGAWEYLEFGGNWTPWEPSKRLHLVAASAFRRYGVGWSFGPAWNGHTEHIGYTLELCGVDLKPDSMAALDLEHSNVLFRQLQSEWKAVFGQNPGVREAQGGDEPRPTAGA